MKLQFLEQRVSLTQLSRYATAIPVQGLNILEVSEVFQGKMYIRYIQMLTNYL
jgi:hypothetical protein